MTSLPDSQSPAARLAADDPGTVAGSEVTTGRRIREFRQLRGLTARTMALASGLSPSFISQLENGQTNASMRSLLRICEVLRISLSDLFAAPHHRERRVLRRDDRPALAAGQGVRKFQLTGTPIRHLEIYQVEMEPGATTGPPEVYGNAQALMVVTEGVATFQLGDVEETLGEGDSIEFETSVPHSIANHGDTRLVAVLTLHAGPSSGGAS